MSRFARFARRARGEDLDRPRHRGIYLLPNAFTTAALFCGFYAIVMAMNLKFEHAAWAIFIAMILDGLDGRVARLTNTQSEFGAQYDSLSDMVSFGAAPALVIYEWSLRGLGKLGWIAAFVYCAGAALRLARFNTNIQVVDKRFFQGFAFRRRSAGGRFRAADGGSGSIRHRAALGIVEHRHVRRPDHGEQRAFLQLQGHQLPQVGAVHCGVPDCAGVRTGVHRSAQGAVPYLCGYGLSGYVVAAWRWPKARKSA
jgi:CDP-diacylglycerol--serine O-phosphatidyltransferase